MNVPSSSSSAQNAASSSGRWLRGRTLKALVAPSGDSSSSSSISRDPSPLPRRGAKRERRMEDPDYDPEGKTRRPAKAKRGRRPGRPRRVEIASDSEDEASPPPPRPRPRRRRAPMAAASSTRAKRARHASPTDSSDEQTTDPVPTGWAELPQRLLEKVLELVNGESVVAAGQTCTAWRGVAKQPGVWRARTLSYDPPQFTGDGDDDTDFFEYINTIGKWHDGAKGFAKVARFAPCLARVVCPKSMKAFAMNAIKKSKCKVEAAELNGQLKWSGDFVLRQTTLRDLTLLNPTQRNLEVSLRHPHLTSLAVVYELDETKKTMIERRLGRPVNFYPYQVPVLPHSKEGSKSLTKLVCHKGVRPEAVAALVHVNAATLEEVAARCFPDTSLRRCARLRRLQICLRPTEDEDQAKLRRLLRGRTLDRLDFVGTSKHEAAPCAALRASLQHRVLAQPILCNRCDPDGPRLKPPMYASRVF